MDSNATRSEQVIESFKKRKVAHSALHKIHRLIESFDEGRKTDTHWAKVGLITIIILLLLGLSIFFFGTTEVTVS